MQGVEGAVARCVAEYSAGAGDTGGDAAGCVLAGDLGVPGPGGFTAEPPRRAGRQAPLRHRLLGSHVEAAPDRRWAGQRELECLRDVVGVHVVQDAEPVVGQRQRQAQCRIPPASSSHGSGLHPPQAITVLFGGDPDRGAGGEAQVTHGLAVGDGDCVEAQVKLGR